MNRFALELAYDGSNYHGWQIQPNAITVQGVINDCLSKFLKEEINVIGAGRTDTGVHASYFVLHFDYSHDIDETIFIYKMNRFLPKDIVLYSIFKVSEDFHARFTATSRSYKYFINTFKNPFNQNYSLLDTAELDIDAMNAASSLLFNYTDFTSFSKLHTDVKTNNCKIYKAKWTRELSKLTFEISADRFLRNMVRAICGTILEIGKGKISIDDFKLIIESKDRNKAGTSAPAHALFLTDITYPSEYLKKN